MHNCRESDKTGRCRRSVMFTHLRSVRLHSLHSDSLHITSLVFSWLIVGMMTPLACRDAPAPEGGCIVTRGPVPIAGSLLPLHSVAGNRVSRGDCTASGRDRRPVQLRPSSTLPAAVPLPLLLRPAVHTP